MVLVLGVITAGRAGPGGPPMAADNPLEDGPPGYLPRSHPCRPLCIFYSSPPLQMAKHLFTSKNETTAPFQDNPALRAMAIHMNQFEGETGFNNTDTNAECQAWLTGLGSSVAGQKLIDHVTHLQSAPLMRSSSAFEQTIGLKRIFMHALSTSQSPFGLPKKFPKFIVAANFSGERLLMYSSNPNLITLLTVFGHGSYDGVEQIITKASMTENATVFLCYSLPFQMGVESLYWECRLITKKGGKFNDKDLACSNWNRQASPSPSTTESESQDPVILKSQVAAFSENLSACDIDVKFEKMNGMPQNERDDPNQAKLMSYITMLQNDRRRMMDDHKCEIEELGKSHATDIQKHCRVMQASFEKQAEDDTILEEKVKEGEAECMMLRMELKKKDADICNLRSEVLSKDETIENDRRTFELKVSELAKEISNLKQQVRKGESDRSTALKKQQVVHQQLHDEAERKLQKAKQSEAFANQSIERIQAVQTAFEGISNEKTVLVAQVEEAGRRMNSFRARLAVQIARSNHMTEMVHKARLDHAECEERLASVKKELKASQQEVEEAITGPGPQDGGDGGDGSDGSDGSDAARSNVETTDSNMQTDILPETLRIGELEAECVKLRDDVAQLKLELGRSKAKNLKRNTAAPGCNQDHGGGGGIGDVQAGSFDSVLESTVQQMQVALKTITDLARQCKTHEQSAREAWSKVNIYESLMHHPQQHPPPPYPMQYLYMHPSGHF